MDEKEGMEHPKTFVSLIASEEFRRADRNRLRSFIVALGIPQTLAPAKDWEKSILETAWQVWGPLGRMLEIRDLRAQNKRTVRHARSATGMRELTTTGDGDHEEPGTEMPSEGHWTWKNLESNTEVFGDRPQEQQLSLPAPVLREQRHRLDATLRGHFDDERSWQAVNFEWLLNYRQVPNKYDSEVSVLNEYRETFRSGIERISDDGKVSEPVVNGVLDRHDPRPDAGLSNVPFCVEATALLQRAYAIFEIPLPFVESENLVRCGVAAFKVPGLAWGCEDGSWGGMLALQSSRPGTTFAND